MHDDEDIIPATLVATASVTLGDIKQQIAEQHRRAALNLSALRARRNDLNLEIRDAVLAEQESSRMLRAVEGRKGYNKS